MSIGIRNILVVFFCLLVSFALVTLWALEWSDVATLHTTRLDGTRRDTHVWYVDEAESVWLDAATAEREFLLDIRRHPEVTLSRDSDSGSYHAEILAEPAAHDRIRERLRGKYGFRDWWIGLLQDTSGSVAVRLRPAGRPPE